MRKSGDIAIAGFWRWGGRREMSGGWKRTGNEKTVLVSNFGSPGCISLGTTF